jgi:hypothetical protein
MWILGVFLGMGGGGGAGPGEVVHDSDDLLDDVDKVD